MLWNWIIAPWLISHLLVAVRWHSWNLHAQIFEWWILMVVIISKERHFVRLVYLYSFCFWDWAYFLGAMFQQINWYEQPFIPGWIVLLLYPPKYVSSLLFAHLTGSICCSNWLSFYLIDVQTSKWCLKRMWGLILGLQFDLPDYHCKCSLQTAYANICGRVLSGRLSWEHIFAENVETDHFI